eukprot:g458.t1
MRRYLRGVLGCKRNQSTTTTHKVFNQARSLSDVDDNPFDDDYALRERARAYLRSSQTDHIARLSSYGKTCGTSLFQDHAVRANQNVPQLMTHDRVGNRVDRVIYDPSYDFVMKGAIEAGVTNFCWRRSRAQEEGAHLTRAMLSMLHYGAESGTGCPLTMSFAAVPCLANSDDPFVRSLAELVSQSSTYDPRDAPISEKRGATVGMSMTEKQGGSDVRSNTTTAFSTKDEGRYELVGHKWFTSAPMCDGFLTLAKIDGSEDLSCFL